MTHILMIHTGLASDDGVISQYLEGKEYDVEEHIAGMLQWRGYAKIIRKEKGNE